MAQHEKRRENSEAHETVVAQGDHGYSKWTHAVPRSDREQEIIEAPSSSRALDEVLVQLKANIMVEQEAMDELLIRLRGRAG